MTGDQVHRLRPDQRQAADHASLRLRRYVKAFEFAATMPGDAIKIMIKLPD
jgi:hypothetical protein